MFACIGSNNECYISAKSCERGALLMVSWKVDTSIVLTNRQYISLVGDDDRLPHFWVVFNIPLCHEVTGLAGSYRPWSQGYANQSYGHSFMNFVPIVKIFPFLWGNQLHRTWIQRKKVDLIIFTKVCHSVAWFLLHRVSIWFWLGVGKTWELWVKFNNTFSMSWKKVNWWGYR